MWRFSRSDVVRVSGPLRDHQPPIHYSWVLTACPQQAHCSTTAVLCSIAGSYGIWFCCTPALPTLDLPLPCGLKAEVPQAPCMLCLSAAALPTCLPPCRSRKHDLVDIRQCPRHLCNILETKANGGDRWPGHAWEDDCAWMMMERCQ
jgi:hypothetical protein